MLINKNKSNFLPKKGSFRKIQENFIKEAFGGEAKTSSKKIKGKLKKLYGGVPYKATKDKDGNEVLTMDDRPLYYYVITISDEGIKTLDTDKDTYTHTHAEYMKKLDKTLGWVFRSMEWTDYHKKTNQR